VKTTVFCRQQYVCSVIDLLDLRGVEDYNTGQGGLWQDLKGIGPTSNAHHNLTNLPSNTSPSLRGAQRPGAGATHGYLRIRMAGLCYDTPPVEAMPFPIAMPDNPPRALSEDLYQEKLPYKPLVERFSRKIYLL
jgi:hypothetical protein